ncbi:OmpA family protein [Myxococcota bacterium]
MLLGFVLAACGIPKEKYQQQVDENKRLQTQLDRTKKEKDALEGKVKGLEDDLSKVRASLKEAMSIVSRLKGAKTELASIKEKMEQERRMREKLMGAFKDMISAGQLKVVNINGRLVIKMASRILFKAGKANLTGRGKKALKRLAEILAKVPRHFQVAGHTDNRPTKMSGFGDNWQLSATRAVNVVRLLRKNGVEGANLSAAAYSEYQPSSTNRTKIGRRLNRRIEITLFPTIPKRVK